MDSQLKRGILTICILQLLTTKDAYGYDIINTEESTFYAILRRLNKDGLTDIYYIESPHGPKRKYYKITNTGKEKLNNYLSSWHEIERIFSDIGIL